MSLRVSRAPLRIGDVIELALEEHTANRLDRLRSRTEPSLNEVTPKGFSPEKAELGIEVLSHFQVLENETIAIAGVIELAHVARLIVSHPSVSNQGRATEGVVSVETDVLIESEVAIDANHRVGGCSLRERRRAVCAYHSDVAAAKDVPPQPEHREVRGGKAELVDTLGLDGQGSDSERSGATGQPPAEANGVDAILREPDTPAEEENGGEIGVVAPWADGAAAARLFDATERVNALSLQKEIALLGEKQAESGQVDLFLVLFDLGKIGVVSEIRDEPSGQPVFGVESTVTPRVI